MLRSINETTRLEDLDELLRRYIFVIHLSEVFK